MGTHDFIEFPAKLANISPQAWLLMGEVEAAVNVIKTIPMQPIDHEILASVYLAKALHGMTAIEGNSLSETDIMAIIGGSADLDPGQMEHLLQIQNINETFALVAEEIFADDMNFSLESFNRYHRRLLKGFADEASLGKIRAHDVEVGAYTAAPADDCELLLLLFCDWLNDDSLPSLDYAGYELSWSIVKALVAHVCFAWIHPYSDGNGQMARLIEQAFLLRAGAPPAVAFVPVYVYSRTRQQFDAELQKTLGELSEGAYPATGEFGGIIEYALAGVRNELGQMMSMIRNAQLRGLYRDYIRRFFPDLMTAVQQRRMRLAAFLAEYVPHTPLNQRDLFDLRDAGHLSDAAQSDNSLDRDIEALIRMGLLTREWGGYLTNPEILESFFGNSGFFDG